MFQGKLISIVKYCIGWPLSLLAIFFIAKLVVNNATVFFQIHQLNILTVILSIFCFLGYFFFRGLLWQKILDAKGHKLSYGDTTYLWAMSEVKRYIPGSIWSVVGRSQSFEEKGVKRKTLFTCMAIEVELIVLASLLLTLPAIFFMLQTIPQIGNEHAFFLLCLTGTFLICLAFLFGNRFLNNSFFKKIPVLKLLFPQKSVSENIALILYALVPIFCFGLGTYFAIGSLIYLNLLWLKEYIGLFVFSLLVGYVSVLAPVGLGIREGIIIYYFSKSISLALSGLVAIFARIVTVISEVLFIILILTWKQISKNKRFIKFSHYLQTNIAFLASILATSIYTLYFTVASFFRYNNFFTGRFDLGNMDQAVWNTMHGRFFQITDANGTQIISRLAYHADFILVLLAPFYGIWSHPEMLLLIQTVVLASGAIFLFCLSKNVLKNGKISFVLSLAYLLAPSVNYTNLYDFHPVALATAFFIAAFYFLEKNKIKSAILFLLLAALTKEEVWIIVALVGLYITFFKKNKIGLVVFAFSSFVFYEIVWKLIPQIRGGQHFALTYYSDFGSTPTGIIKNMLFSPIKTITALLDGYKIMYLLELVAPVALLCFAAPLFLVFALPDVMINLLSTNTQFHQIYYQYSSTITPFIFIAAVYGIRNITKRFPFITLSKLSLLILVFAVVSAYAYGPLPGAKSPNISMFTHQELDANIIDQFLDGIPAKYSIAATNNLGSHLSHRQKIYTIPVGIDQADIITFLLNDQFAQPSLTEQKAIVEKMKNDKNYNLIFEKNDFVVFTKTNISVQLRKKKMPAFLRILFNRN